MSKFSKNLSKLKYFDDEPDFVYSPPLDYISAYMSTVRPLLEETTFNDGKRDVLVSILRQTPTLIQEEGIDTKKEKDVHDALEKVLKLAFPDVLRGPSIQQPSKTYKPDFGIESIGVAVELKYAKEKKDVGTVLGGLYEDMKGYNGSSEYTNFYGLFYMTGAYFSQERMNAEAKRVSISKNWEIIIVAGK